jgi:hypothetical protein
LFACHQSYSIDAFIADLAAVVITAPFGAAAHVFEIV